jgi:hypothetical protein
VLIARAILDRIVAGDVTLAFRRWDAPRVRAGGRQRTAVGVIEFTAVREVAVEKITERDARRAGLPSRDALLAQQAHKADKPMFRVEVRFAGPDPRAVLREHADLGDDELEQVAARLAAMDARSAHGPWTESVLALIEAKPGILAEDLARELGREKRPFKADVRKLKELGLTESLRIGYRLSPRGNAYRAWSTG